VNFDGAGKIEDFGFILSSSLSTNSEESYWIRGQGNPDGFELRFNESPFTPTLYFRSWAKNPAGYGMGPVKKLRIPETAPIWWGETVSMPGGWMQSSWFGLFIYYEQGWLYHSQMGWLYTSTDNKEGVWLWNDTHGWLWTKEDVWPYLYKNDHQDWLYYTTSKNQIPIFYDYSTSSYVGLDTTYEAEEVLDSQE